MDGGSNRRKQAGGMAGASIALLLAVTSCGDGGATPTPPDDAGQTVTVQVSTVGVDVDADGYTVLLGSRSASVASSGAATFDGVSAGSYDVRLSGVADNCYVEGASTTTLTVSASRGAQTSISVRCTLDFGDGLPTAACEGVSLAAPSGVPGDRIEVRGTAGLGSPIVGQVRAADDAERAFALIDSLDSGGIGMVTPLHPNVTLQGGPVWIRVTDGAVGCPPVPFTVAALPAAEGELAAIVELLTGVLRAQMAVLETTPEELAQVPLEEVPQPLLPLAVMQRVLDHPDNPSSLQAMANGDGTAAGTLAAVEALLARTGLRQRLEGALGGPRTAPTPGRSTIDPGACTVAAIGGDTERLSDCMFAAKQIATELQNTVRDDIIRRMANALLAAVAVGGGQQTAVRATLALVPWAWVNLELTAWARLPLSLQRLTVGLTPDRFGEDDDRVGYLDAQVSAFNLPWQPEDHPFGSITSISQAIYEVLESLGAAPASLDHGLSLYIEDQIAGRLDPRVHSVEQFGPVPVNDPMWSTVEWAGDGPGGSPAVTKVTHTTYRAAALGSTSVNVSVPGSDAEAFGGESITARFAAGVDAIDIRITPSDTILDPTKQAVFLVAVEHARFEDSLAITTKQPSTAGFAPVAGPNDEFVLVYTPPPNASFADPDSLHIEHTARYGARVGGPRRFDHARIRFGAVVISSPPSCIDVSQEVAFAAQVLGLDNQEVRWSTDVGSIGENDGVFRAPATRPNGGVATIKAVSVEEPGLEAEVAVPIGCTCAFGLTLGGQPFGPQPGDRMVFSTDTIGPNARLLGMTLTRASESWSLAISPQSENPSEWPNASGSWPVMVQGDFGLTSPADILYATEPDALGVLTLDILDPARELRGRVGGTAELVSTATPGPIPFDWWFSIRLVPGQIFCSVE